MWAVCADVVHLVEGVQASCSSREGKQAVVGQVLAVRFEVCQLPIALERHSGQASVHQLGRLGVVDADEIDVGVRPERVEVEIHVAAAILRTMAEVFRPVGGIAALGGRPEDAAYAAAEGLEAGDGRLGAGPRA